ncbi:MAG TPA: FMN-binding negative transcriptional regulator [Opitutaceae bacterium]|jgi:transcriptional regulator
MYIPAHFEEKDPAVLHALIRSHPFGTWVYPGPAGPVANHLPLLLDAAPGGPAVLTGHVARANRAWMDCGPGQSLVIFQGPEAYITPSWYEAKKADGKVVPTWNYAVVHAYGAPKIHDDREWLRAHVTRLTAVHEAGEESPWAPSDAPADYIDRMLAAIVGVEIPVERLEGKWKLGQNRTGADRLAAASGLSRRPDEGSREVGLLMARTGKPAG